MSNSIVEGTGKFEVTKPTNIFIPQFCNTLENVSEAQIRLGLQGFGGTGKTYSALTFPNPVVANIDKGLGVHCGRKDVIEIPFWNPEYCKQIDINFNPDNLKDLVLKFVATTAHKFTEEQTFVFDGGTGMQNAYHKWYTKNKVVTSSGKVDDRAEWRLKIPFFTDLFEELKKLKCHVVYIVHETPNESGKIRPLMSGQVGDQMMTHFTDWFRQRSAGKLKDYKSIDAKDLAKWGCKTHEEFQMIMDSYKDTEAMYYWQTQSDDEFDGKVSSIKNPPKFIPANYNIFKLYSKTK